jgi:hypothetical protein
MSDPISPLVAAGQVLSLTTALAKLIEQSKANDKNSDSLAQILYHLRGESIRITQELAAELRGLYEVLGKEDVLGKPISELTKDLRWYNFVSRHRLNAARDKFYEMHRLLTSFLDDVTAVLLCSGTMDTATGAFSVCDSTKQGLDSVISSGKSVKEILGAMINAADEAQKLLQGGKK